MPSRVVITPQTERARLAITQAMHDCMYVVQLYTQCCNCVRRVVFVYDPVVIGTRCVRFVATSGVTNGGHHDLLKDLAGACAVPLVGLSIHSASQVDTVARVLTGVCATGMWCALSGLDSATPEVALRLSHMVRAARYNAHSLHTHATIRN